MQNRSGIHLSVVIPAFNEERRLPSTLKQVLRYLAAQAYLSEVIVVDDGSTDDTEQVVREQMTETVPLHLVKHPDAANHGKGAAVRRGLWEARGEFRLFMDADHSTTIEQVERFWPPFEDGYDIVIGSRDIDGAQITVSQPWPKALAGDLGNLFIRVMAVPGIHDTQAGFKMFTAACVEDVFPHLTLDRWGFDIEILAIAQRRGYRIKEIPITWTNSPESKVGLGAYFEVLGEVWRIRRNLRSGVYDRS